MNYLFSFFLFLANHFVASCQEFRISATVTGFPNGTVFYVDEVHTQQTIASGKINDGQLTITGSLAESPVMLLLKTVLANKGYGCFILMGNENVLVRGDIKDFPFHMTVSGSIYEDENELLKSQTREFDRERDSISQNLFELVKDTSPAGKERMIRIAGQQAYYDRITDSITIRFIKEHLQTHAAINQLYYLRKKFAKDSVEILYTSLSDPLKESIFGRKLFTYLRIGNVLKVGDTAFDFEAQDEKGNIFNLAAVRGKFVLLDFTETYCVPCIHAVDELRFVAKKYSDKLTVISFCADKQKDTWIKGIRRDKPDWLCLWDGKGSASETPLKYGVNSYPTFILINPQGKIASRFSGFSAGLIERELLKFVGE